MHVVIIEDEYPNFTRLRKQLLTIDPEMIIDGPLESNEQTRAYLHENNPDVIFSDIRLCDGLSFESLTELPPEADVIFTTAYDEYALKAFQHNGIAYLMKPIDKEELSQALERVHLRTAPKVDVQALNKLFEQHLSSRNTYRERFLVPKADGYKLVLVEDINHIASENKQTRLYLNDGTSVGINFSLYDLEQQLHPNHFFRANRQYIVALDSIHHISNFFGGKTHAHLKGYPDVSISVSRERTPELKEWLDK